MTTSKQATKYIVQTDPDEDDGYDWRTGLPMRSYFVVDSQTGEVVEEYPDQEDAVEEAARLNEGAR